MKGFDTHIHTTASDGACTVEQVVQLARPCLQGIAITDHDTVGALAEAERLSQKYAYPIIPGIELSTEINGQEAHILGYFIDIHNEPLLQKLQELQLIRQNRITEMLARLAEYDMPLSLDELNLDEGQSAGRPHIARAMVRKRYVRDEKEAFTKWLSDNSPCYVGKARLDSFEAIDLIKQAGGIPCIAHPGIDVPFSSVLQLIDYGLQGIEIYHPEHSSADEISFYNLAKEKGLIYLGGSDFHGTGDKYVGLKFTPMEQVEILYRTANRSI